MITVVVFSRDRALQLDATLRSFLLHCEDALNVSLYAIIKATNPKHEKQYAILSEELAQFKNIYFMRQKNFRNDVLTLIQCKVLGRHIRFVDKVMLNFGYIAAPLGLSSEVPRGNFILFLVDDNLFVHNFSLAKIEAGLNAEQDALGFSLRLGRNTTYCYVYDHLQVLPRFERVDEQVIKFNWTVADQDFGYPIEISSSVYRLEDLYALITGVRFNNPNRLEERLSILAKKFREKKPFLLCYEQSVTFCNPINKVQTVLNNRSGHAAEYSSEQLAAKFNAGYRVNVEAYNGFVSNACHQEVTLEFEHKSRTRDA